MAGSYSAARKAHLAAVQVRREWKRHLRFFSRNRVASVRGKKLGVKRRASISTGAPARDLTCKAEAGADQP